MKRSFQQFLRILFLHFSILRNELKGLNWSIITWWNLQFKTLNFNDSKQTPNNTLIYYCLLSKLVSHNSCINYSKFNKYRKLKDGKQLVLSGMSILPEKNQWIQSSTKWKVLATLLLHSNQFGKLEWLKLVHLFIFRDVLKNPKCWELWDPMLMRAESNSFDNSYYCQSFRMTKKYLMLV